MALVVKGLVVPLGCPVWCYHFVCSVYHVLDMLPASVHMNIFKKKFLKKYFFNKVADKTPAYCQFLQPTEQIVHYTYIYCRVSRSFPSRWQKSVYHFFPAVLPPWPDVPIWAGRNIDKWTGAATRLYRKLKRLLFP